MANDAAQRPASELLAGNPSPRFAAGFVKYVRWMISRSFHAVRMVDGTEAQLSELRDVNAPVIVLLSHASWWDPLIALFLAHRFMPQRSGCAPMDITQLRKFGFFRKLGVFGIDPDAPDAAALMHRYVGDCFAHEQRPTLWITPQGAFADVRDTLRVRPGAAALAAAHAGCRVVSIAIEYGFWIDRKPEIFLRAQRCEPRSVHSDSRPSLTAWQRGIIGGMTENASALAELVIRRDPDAFSLLCGRQAGINPAVDLWLKLRGRSVSLDSQRMKRPPSPRTGADRTNSVNTD